MKAIVPIDQGHHYADVIESTVAIQPFRLQAPIATRGVPIGHYLDPVGVPFEFDPWLLQREGRIKAAVAMILGDIGHGKTSLAKVIAMRLAALDAGGRRIRIGLDDTKTNDSDPEYRRLAEFFGSEEIRLRDHRLNLLDQKLGMKPEEMFTIMIGVCEHIGGRLTEGQRFVLQISLHSLLTERNQHKQASLEDLIGSLLYVASNDAGRFIHERIIQNGHDFAERFSDEELARDAKVVAYRLMELLRGGYGNMFGGTDSLAELLAQDVVALDYSGLDPQALTLIQSLIWRWKSSATGRGDTRFMIDMEIHDENYGMWEHLVYARSMYSHVKKIRGKGGFLVMNSHRLEDYFSVGSEGSEQRQLAVNMLDDVTIWFLGRLPASAVEDLRQRLGFSHKVAQRLRMLERGQFCCIIGNEEPKFLEVFLTSTEDYVCETEGANKRIVSSYFESSRA